MSSTKGPGKPGRPRKAEGPRVPYDEVDRLLVHGEVVKSEDGKSDVVVYPSYRDLANRFGVAHSLIHQYGRKYNCLRRREQARSRLAAKVEQKVLEMRATALALSKEDGLRMIDTYLLNFEKALADGRVRYDNPSDFNTMLRLKEFILGNADSRQEVHAVLSLEDLQARHRQMLRMQRGEVDARDAVIDVEPEQNQSLPAPEPPSPSSRADAGETHAQFQPEAEVPEPAVGAPTDGVPPSLPSDPRPDASTQVDSFADSFSCSSSCSSSQGSSDRPTALTRPKKAWRSQAFSPEEAGIDGFRRPSDGEPRVPPRESGPGFSGVRRDGDEDEASDEEEP